ncbi:DNA topoisomerase I, mitochondrial isoform X2 [Phyllobates terribilis]|uniref:DNA topoisomerase I, mitochondrial isoform X2 n=1 Tax=Phyllobates terribilis TaxID=111132 RepID=UPI003CCB1664
MVVEEVLCQTPEDLKLSQKNPSKAVKLDRTRCLEAGGRSPTADRKRKLKGDQKREHNKEEPSKKNKSSTRHQSHNDRMEVGQAAFSEKLIQENIVSCASEQYLDPAPNSECAMKTLHLTEEDTRPVTTSGLDENHNVLQEESELKMTHCNGRNRKSQIAENEPVKEQALGSTRISELPSDAQEPHRLPDDLPIESANGEKDHEDLPKDHRDQTREPRSSVISENDSGTKALKEKENCAEKMGHLSKKRDQSGGADKKLKEHNEEVKKKDHHESKEKADREKSKTREKVKSKVKETEVEDRDQNTGRSAIPKKTKQPNDKHKDPSKSKEGRSRKHEHRVKEETPDTEVLPKENGSVLKMTLVDLDLFQETLTDDKKHKSKSRSRDKRGSDDKQKKADDKDSKRHREREREETKGIKREVEEPQKDEESKTGHKKPKLDPEKDQKTQKEDKGKPRSKKRKNEGEEGETKAKKTKEEKQKEEEESKWKWWEEKNYEDGVKWKFLEHRGPYFAPAYEPLPDDVRFQYDGEPMKLSPAAEEVATFYGKMLDHEYTTKEIFQKNFFTDWKTQMSKEEKKTIKHLYKCDFSEIHKYFYDKNEARKALPKEEKQKLKEETSKIQEEYGYCTLDGHREKIGNFKIEPPGLFRGRGDHPKMGMLKLRIKPEDVIINCSKDAKVPEPPPGHRWKEVRFDNAVTWLASWTENIQGSIKYIMLNPSSKLKGEKDWQKYETARRLKGVVAQIRSQYRMDWKSREMKKRQRAVALYFIDKLALRAGNEKEEGETADTVGCCSLRVEHIQLYPEMAGQQYVVEFDFLGKDSIRYYNKVPVEKEVFKNLKLFMENKNPDDDLFDRLNTSILNKHLQDLMDGLTAKVFRTYNASITLQDQLKALTNEEDNVAAKILSYNRANRAVALLCNHQRALPKTYEKSMQNLQAKIDAKELQVKEAKKELKKAKADHKAKNNDRTKKEMEKKKKQCERLEEQLMKLKLQATDKEENKQIALGTSKLNYLDPRITVAWCKKYGVPIEKIYNKTQREKFAWAIDMTNEDFEF